MFVSIVQRDGALSTPQKQQLVRLAERIGRAVASASEAEWVIAREGRQVVIGLRVRTRGRLLRARATGTAVAAVAREVVERISTQGTRAKRARVDRRNDLSPKGRGGRRRRRRTP